MTVTDVCGTAPKQLRKELGSMSLIFKKHPLPPNRPSVANKELSSFENMPIINF